MATKLTPNKALDEFVDLALGQRLFVVNGLDVKAAKKLFKDMLKEAIPKRTFSYILTPKMYLESFAGTMCQNQLQITKVVSDSLSPQFKHMDALSKAFFESMVVYFVQCQLHNDLSEADLTADLNYFTKPFDQDKLLDGPFGTKGRIPSTFFGTRPLKLFELSLPSDHDFLITYNKYGVLTSLMYYQGHGFINYTPGSCIGDYFEKQT